MKSFEEYRIKQFSDLAFWMAPLAAVTVIASFAFDRRHYPESWEWMLPFRLLVLLPSILSIILLKQSRLKIRPELLTLPVPLYIVAMHCYFITATNYENSEYYNAIIQVLLGLVIMPYRPTQMLGLFAITLGMYLATIAIGSHLFLVQIFDIRYFSALSTYVVLILSIYFLLHKFRKSQFLNKRALEEELLHREERIALMLAKEQSARDILARAQLAGQIAHDLRSPLGALKIGITKIETAEPGTLELTHSALSRITEISEALLSQYRESGAYKATPYPRSTLRACIDQLAEEKNLTRNSNLDFKIRTLNPRGRSESKLPHEMALNLKRVLSNILDNALEASSNTARIHISYTENESDFSLRVRDFGSGLPMRILKDIFSGNSYGKGRLVGLGIKGSQTLINDLGGTISIKNGVRLGAVVTVTIPLDRLRLAVGQD